MAKKTHQRTASESSPQSEFVQPPGVNVREVMDVDEVAAYLGFSPETIYKKVQAREIPFTRIGNILRFTRWSINAWLDRNTTQPDESLFDQFVRLQSRYHFLKWLEGRGVNWRTLTPEQLAELASKAITDLKEAPASLVGSPPGETS